MWTSLWNRVLLFIITNDSHPNRCKQTCIPSFRGQMHYTCVNQLHCHWRHIFSHLPTHGRGWVHLRSRHLCRWLGRYLSGPDHKSPPLLGHRISLDPRLYKYTWSQNPQRRWFQRCFSSHRLHSGAAIRGSLSYCSCGSWCLRTAHDFVMIDHVSKKFGGPCNRDAFLI